MVAHQAANGANAANRASAVAVVDAAEIPAYQAADTCLCLDDARIGATGNDTGAVPVDAHEAADAPISSRDSAIDAAVDDLAIAPTHETANMVSQSIDIHDFQSEMGDHSSTAQSPDQADIVSTANTEPPERMTIGIEDATKARDNRRRPANPCQIDGGFQAVMGLRLEPHGPQVPGIADQIGLLEVPNPSGITGLPPARYLSLGYVPDDVCHQSQVPLDDSSKKSHPALR